MLAPAAALLLAASVSAADPAPAPARYTPPHEMPSLASARTLGDGGSALLFTAGVPFLSAAYAQGISSGLDLGGQLEFDWFMTALFGGATLRKAAWISGDLDVAIRGRAGFYANAGSTWTVSENRSDGGLQLAPGIVGSGALAAGTLSLALDLPLTLTAARGGGVVFAPRIGLSFETPLYGDWTAGARVGGSWHAATGGAPLADDSRGFVDFAALLTYRLF
jgi:hypothetical protein